MPDILNIWAEPETQRMAVTHIADISFRFNITGDKDSGETVLFLNNLFNSFESWSPVLSHFDSDKYCFLRLDYRGQWYTEAGNSTFTFESQVEHICQLLDQLEIDQIHLVGQGLGAEIGLWFALRYPDRVISLSVLSALAAMDDIHYQTCQRWRRLVSQTLDQHRTEIPVNRYLPQQTLYESLAEDRFGTEYMVNHGSDLLEASKHFEQRLTTNILMGFIYLIDQKCRLQRAERLSEHLGEIYTPTLVMNGAQDKFSAPRTGAIISRALPMARHIIVPGAGHELVQEKSIIVGAQLASFIDQYSANSSEIREPIGFYGIDQLFGAA